ncbi:MAG: EAL domain-containing protein, partial [Acidimicrobiia bacterium]
ARLEQQEAIVELGRDVLPATSLAIVFESARSTIERVLDTSRCRITLSGPSRVTASTGAKNGLASDRPVLTVPVGDPDEPLGQIEIDAATRLTAPDCQFVEGVAGIVFSAMVRARAEEAIRHQAEHDPLTGLPNRTLFNDRLEHALSRLSRVGGYIAVMIVDLDGFKTVNDSLGHVVGDALLVAVAQRFQEQRRDFDTISRLGGDEFAILVDDLRNPADAEQVAQRLLESLRAPLELGERTVAIGASIGVAIADRSERLADELLGHADAAMYRAKRDGKGCYRTFEAEMHTAAVNRMNLEQSLRRALAEGVLTVHYQPIVCTQQNRVTSFEALARWPDSVRSFVSPEEFIPIAEDTGLIIDIGRQVLLRACQQARAWQQARPGVRAGVAVNASRLQLAGGRFVDDVTRALSSTGLHATSLTIEVTESVIAGDGRYIIEVLNALRSIGVRVAIDDFGTGYSSFASLAELPIDVIKIDKRFVDNVTRSHEGLGVVKAIQQLATTLHLDTVAEGVERSEQAEVLIELGCTTMQGYLFARPMQGDLVVPYLDQSTTSIPRSYRPATTVV